MIDLQNIAHDCLNCRNARCHEACPCGNEIPAILAAVKEGDYALAAKRLHETNPFPELTSLLCDHQRQCRGHCIRGIRGNPIDFPAVEYALSQQFPFDYVPGKNNGKKVAIIGAGPAGLSAATFLIQAGFAVEIFEKEPMVGGAILTGIPAFRFDKNALAKIQKELTDIGVVFHFNVCVDASLRQRLSTEFDEVLLAIGAEKENRLQTPECKGIYFALTLLHDLNVRNESHGLEQCKNVIVMGGGNVAMDIARSLARRGIPTKLIYRRDEASMPAAKVEIQEAKDDGVIFEPLTNVAGYDVENGKLCGLTLVSMGLGEKDESGRPSFFTIEGSERSVPCDAFIMAIGEKSDLTPVLGDTAIEDAGCIAVGDCRYGAKNIASAIKDGREAAHAIIEKYA